jgi:hypothetical protein
MKDYYLSQSYGEVKQSNAAIDRAGSICGTAKFTMRDTLIPLRSNRLLGFVRRHHSAAPDRSTLILSFNVATAAGRCNLPSHQLSLPARGSQHSRLSSTQQKILPDEDSRLQFQYLSHSIQQKPNARINPPEASALHAR